MVRLRRETKLRTDSDEKEKTSLSESNIDDPSAVNKIEELRRRKAAAKLAGGEERIARQHARLLRLGAGVDLNE